jgi:dipeptidyl aminopeptidase/acylaminoacyl peptidase
MDRSSLSQPSDARTIARYGEWPSPISAESVAAHSGSSSAPSAVGHETWWCTADPATATVHLVRSRDGAASQAVLDDRWSVRNRSLGYGGRPYLAIEAGQPAARPDAHLLVFTEHSDQRLYRTDVAPLDTGDSAAEPAPLSPADPPGQATCYADPILGPCDREVWVIRETTLAAGAPHDDPAPRTRREIVSIPLDGSAADDHSAIRVVGTSHHFLSGARLSPDGRRLAWIGWDHPAMPWDTTELMVADLVAGPHGALIAASARAVLGGGDVSVPQVEWGGPDRLYAMADPDGWWNLHQIDLRAAADPIVTCVLPMQRECAGPMWRVGPTWFGVSAHGVVLIHGDGEQQLALWDATTSALTDLAPGWTEFSSDVRVGPDVTVFLAGSPRDGRTVLRVSLAPADGAIAGPERAVPATNPDEWTAWPQRRVATGADGRAIHYLYYPPTSPTHAGPADELPPLLIDVHGGPTSSTGATPDREFDLFCSRGFAVASVDYGGSTGYGRAYRERLRHRWGIVDVEDSVAVAAQLAREGLADPARTAVRGGSAGGWTSLACLAFSDAFCAGTVYYPISDPLLWSGGHTHDFESRYVDSLVGTLPGALEHYRAVSPAANAGRISSPLIILQGDDDFICPPEQAEAIVETVAAHGGWHRYLTFAGEGHGFRKQSSVRDSLLAELELYSYAMGINANAQADRDATSANQS